MENQNLIENSKFYKSDRELDYSLKKEKLQNELLLLEEELEEASIIKKFSLKLKIVDKKMQIDLLELVIKDQKENEEKLNMIKKDFILVEGGSYFPSFTNEEKEVFDIEVCKYPTTQKMWIEVMESNPSKCKGDNKPVEKINWWQALEYCNKLSERHGLEPVYDLSKSEQGILMIKELGGETVYPDVANFKNTEGFRLPTEVEWEWFARGGQIAIEQGTFDYTYSGNNNINEVAWFKENSGSYTHDVGLKKPNQLGLYDCSGNVLEWCYDTIENIEEGKNYIYKAFDSSNICRRVKGGTCRSSSAEYCAVFDRDSAKAVRDDYLVGLRVVRTI